MNLFNNNSYFVKPFFSSSGLQMILHMGFFYSYNESVASPTGPGFELGTGQTDNQT